MAKQTISTVERRATCFGRLADSYACLTCKQYATPEEKEGAGKLAVAARAEAEKPASPAPSEAESPS